MTSELKTLIDLGSGLIKLGKKPNPNDWKGWNYGDAKHWVKNDGDSVENEASNIVSFMSKPGFDLDMMINDDGYGVTRVTPRQIQDKLSRGGHQLPSSAIPQTSTNDFFNNPLVRSNPILKALPQLSVKSVMEDPSYESFMASQYADSGRTKKAGIASNIWAVLLMVGIAVAAVFGFRSNGSRYKRR